MDNDFDIELQSPGAAEEKTVRLPVNFVAVGDVEADDVRVYVKQSVYDALEKYAAQDVKHERGTILLGEYGQEHGKTHVVVSDYIEAKYTDASASTLTFTHATWDYVSKEHETKFPEKTIVGWQHTHPGYGIFLSNYDLFIHENFFDLPFQIAYVIDPVQKLRGFFQWKNGRIEKLKGFYVYDDIGKKIAAAAPKDAGKVSPPKVNGRVVNIVVSLLAVAVIALTAGLIAVRQKYSRSLTEQELAISRLSEEVAAVRTSVPEPAEGTPAETPPAEDETDVPATEAPTADTEDASVRLIRYTVRKGDTICGICESNGISYAENYRLIAALNGLQDPDNIRSGQTLLLPKENDR